MTKSIRTVSQLIALGAVTFETKGVSSSFSPDETLQRKPMPGLAGD